MKRITGLLALLLVLCLAPHQAQAVSIVGFENRFRKAIEADLSDYSTCYKGDCDSNVRKVKARLKTLGYYSSTATFDDEFNDIMVQRVKDFQENNGLPVTGDVNSATVSALKGFSPIRGPYYEGWWDEPDVTLIAPDITYARWDKRDCDQMGFSVEYKNVSTTRKVVAVELLVYTKDVWGNELISSDYPYSYTLNDTFGTGAKKYTGYMLIPYCSDTYEVYCAINKVRYDDGYMGYVDDPNYLCWTIRW
ncbi:MAG: peptidoglycan-binding protein [Clostridia bacterium]|nr:peptidoglycan-binding protein [Clostridia bacterium]